MMSGKTSRYLVFGVCGIEIIWYLYSIIIDFLGIEAIHFSWLVEQSTLSLDTEKIMEHIWGILWSTLSFWISLCVLFVACTGENQNLCCLYYVKNLLTLIVELTLFGRQFGGLKYQNLHTRVILSIIFGLSFGLLVPLFNAFIVYNYQKWVNYCNGESEKLVEMYEILAAQKLRKGLKVKHIPKQKKIKPKKNHSKATKKPLHKPKEKKPLHKSKEKKLQVKRPKHKKPVKPLRNKKKPPLVERKQDLQGKSGARPKEHRNRHEEDESQYHPVPVDFGGFSEESDVENVFEDSADDYEQDDYEQDNPEDVEQYYPDDDDHEHYHEHYDDTSKNDDYHPEAFGDSSEEDIEDQDDTEDDITEESDSSDNESSSRSSSSSTENS